MNKLIVRLNHERTFPLYEMWTQHEIHGLLEINPTKSTFTNAPKLRSLLIAIFHNCILNESLQFNTESYFCSGVIVMPAYLLKDPRYSSILKIQSHYRELYSINEFWNDFHTSPLGFMIWFGCPLFYISLMLVLGSVKSTLWCNDKKQCQILVIGSNILR